MEGSDVQIYEFLRGNHNTNGAVQDDEEPSVVKYAPNSHTLNTCNEQDDPGRRSRSGYHCVEHGTY